MKHLVLTALMLMITAPVAAQQQFTRTLNVDGLNRQYIIYLPAGFSADENMPVMMWHHGGGGTAQGGLFEADFRSLADDERFIAVYAQAYPDVLESCTCWGYEEPGGYSNGNYEIDLAYTSAVIDDLAANYNADRQRIYAGGYSMGGSYVWDLACVKSDEIAAVAPVAASCYPWTFDACDSAEPIAVCHILATNDFYAPYNGGWVPSAAAQYNYWVEKNQSDPTPQITNLSGGVTQYTWGPGEGCHGYEHFRHGGGHVVPGFAVQAIWDFVSQYTLDGVPGCNDADCPGDVTGDAVVGVNDLLAVIAGWGSSDGDTDGNGTTDVDDLLIVIGNWNVTCP
ncbi:MAG: alpha/beta hydrolase-fold protein [Planctomycetota bacterium]|nr:alpha/beta hydrolase-fold protein [Planctomycetota bacterium]